MICGPIVSRLCYFAVKLFSKVADDSGNGGRSSVGHSSAEPFSKDPLVGRLDQNVFLRSVETVLILSPRGYQQHATTFHR